jgi:hypothetical protein
VQDTVGVAGGEVLRVHALAEGELPGERPLGSLGDKNPLAVAVVGVRSARIVKVLCSTVTSTLSGSTPGRSASRW